MVDVISFIMKNDHNLGDNMKKRFIAGASCPKCHQKDVIILSQENNKETISCIECGFQEKKDKLIQKIEPKWNIDIKKI